MNLKKIIKEELDDEWSWTQSEPNIWLSYQLLIFNETPTKEEIIKFIRDAFKSGLVKNEAIRTWELEGIEDEAEAIYDYCQQGVAPYLRIDLNNGWLYYGSHIKDIVDKHPELRKIYFSEAKKYSINESDFDWINEIEPELTICDAINYLSVGDTIRVLNIEDWKNSNIIHDSLIAEVLEIDNCNDIMEDNESKDLTILIHFKEEYGGFTRSWYNTLNSKTSKEICSDGRCMFLICGEDGKEQEGVRVKPLSKDYINESEEDEWGWAKETNIDIPTNKNELEYFIGWSFLWDESGKKTGVWGYNGRLWEITGIDNNLVYYYDTKDKTANDTDIREFLRNLNDGSWVLVSPEGDILDPKYNRTYNKKINESNDDWTWVEETNINLPKTEEDLKDFIGWSFVWDKDMENHTGMWGYNGKEWKITQLELGEVWFKDQNSGVYHVENVDRFLTRIGEGSWVLVSPEGYLLDPQYNRTYNKNINESDEDFKWIEDVDPKDMIFRIGDIIKVHNVGDEDSFLSWLGDYSDDFLDNRFGEFIVGEIVGLDDKRIEIRERYTDEYIFFPTYLDMENVRNGGSFGRITYEGLDMYYEILSDEN